MKGTNMFFVQVQGSIIGGSHPDLVSARRAANSFLLSRRSEKRAEIVPHIPGGMGGVGLPVSFGKKNVKGQVVWKDQ